MGAYLPTPTLAWPACFPSTSSRHSPLAYATNPSRTQPPASQQLTTQRSLPRSVARTQPDTAPAECQPSGPVPPAAAAIYHLSSQPLPRHTSILPAIIYRSTLLSAAQFPAAVLQRPLATSYSVFSLAAQQRPSAATASPVPAAVSSRAQFILCVASGRGRIPTASLQLCPKAACLGCCSACCSAAGSAFCHSREHSLNSTPRQAIAPLRPLGGLPLLWPWLLPSSLQHRQQAQPFPAFDLPKQAGNPPAAP